MRNNEVTVVLLCCRVYLQTSTISDLKTFISRHTIQWRRVYDLCAKHRIRPLTFRIISQIAASIPPDVLQLFRNYCREFLLFAVDRQIEATRVTALLHDRGISARLYKGTDCALLLHRDIGMREFTDIDIIIEADQAPSVIPIMEEEGYEMHLGKYFSRYPAHFRRHIKEVVFSKRCPRGKRFSFEFHYRPTKALMDMQCSFDSMLGDNYLHKEYTHEDYYKLMLVNNGASDFYPHLRSLIDMVLLYRKGPFPVPAALHSFEQLWQQLAGTLLGFQAAAPLPAHKNTYALLMKRLQDPEPPGKFTLLQQARVHMTLGADIRYRFSVALRYLIYLIRPNGNDFNALQLPYFLYYFTKPVRLASNILRGRK